MKLGSLRFEDSSIVNLEFHNVVLILTLEDVQEIDDSKSIEKPEKQFSGKLIFSGVSDLMANQVPAKTIEMLFAEGGIKHFELENKSAKIFINWCDYDAKKEESIFYKFNFQEVVWQPLREYYTT